MILFYLQIFNRSKKGVTLTEHGKQLFVTSSPSFEHVGNINQITTSHLHNYSGTLQITAFKDFLCAKNLDCF